LIPLIAEAMLAKTMEQWVALLKANNVPCGPINDIKQVFEGPQVDHRQMQIELPHSVGGSAPAVTNPISFSDTPIRYRQSAPTLGEHNEDILQRRLGLTKDRLAHLAKRALSNQSPLSGW
jgi:crotonobetainyl-CoA:carnitine CoA-transferase CaiB-like acyl-CoA transferase